MKFNISKFLLKFPSSKKPASFSTKGYKKKTINEILKSQSLGIYIHIPFCKKLCDYCGFNRYLYKQSLFQQYLKSLNKEIKMYSEKPKLKDSIITRIYVGGGTPSLLSKEQIKEIFHNLKDSFIIDEKPQIGMEGTFETTNYDKLKAFYSCGGERLSFGVQSFHERLLKLIGRDQNLERIPEVIEVAHEIGFRNINIDLIYGLPTQIMEEWEEDLNHAIALGIEQISIYPLMLLPNAKLSQKVNEGIIDLPNKERDTMYNRAVEILTKAGYNYNELYAFHKSPKRFDVYCTFEQNDEYIGLGAGAHSIAFGHRYYNTYSPAEYIREINRERFPIVAAREFSEREKITMWFMYELGVWHKLDLNEFKLRYGVDFKKNFGRMIMFFKLFKLITENNGYLSTTKRGKLFFNNHFEKIITQCAIPNPPYYTISEREKSNYKL